MPRSTPLPNDVPAEAFVLAADVKIEKTGDDPLAPVPIKVFARSAQPLDHWYWGRSVHDMEGMFSKPTIPFDYCHNWDEILGQADQHEASNAGLTVSGELVPFTPTDRASEIKHKAARGVPYEASINFGGAGLLIEQVGEGAVAQVNGYQFEGPGVIFRKWPLRGVAICPYGYDGASQLMLKAGGPTVPVKYLTPQGATMPPATAEQKPADQKTVAEELDPKPAAEDKPKPADDKPADEKPADKPAEGADAGDAKPADKPPADAPQELTVGQTYLEAFGPQGGVWFAEGRSFDDAQKLHNLSQQQRRTELESENAKLKAQVTQLRGEKDPLSFETTPTAEQRAATELTNKYGDDKVAKVAAAIKMPKKK